MTIRLKPRARYTDRLGTWACWLKPDDYIYRLIGYGHTLAEALQDMERQRSALAGVVR